MGLFGRRRSPGGALHGPASSPVDLTVESWASFLRAGGSVGLDEWLALDGETRTAIEQAGIAVMADFACALAQAMSGPEGLVEVAALADGGRSREEAMASATLEAAMSLMRRQGAVR
jgi:hypothetical protein